MNFPNLVKELQKLPNPCVIVDIGKKLIDWMTDYLIAEEMIAEKMFW